MAKGSYPQAIRLIFRHEGGYVDHPLDPAGATNRGITRATLAAWRGRPVSKAEVMALSEREAADIYRERYWNAVRADDLPAGVELVVFDAAVNSGPARAARWLNQALGLGAQARISDRTLQAAASHDPGELIRAYGRTRLGFLQRLRTWGTFGRGWGRRVRETEEAALALARAPEIPRRPGAPPANKEKTTMKDSKSILTSKTLWANLIGLTAVLGGLFGIETGALDQGALGEAIPQAIAAVSFIASSIFRVSATKRLTTGEAGN